MMWFIIQNACYQRLYTFKPFDLAQFHYLKDNKFRINTNKKVYSLIDINM